MKKKLWIVAILALCIGLLWAATGDETVSLTDSYDQRFLGTAPVWKHTVTAVFDDDDTGNVTQAIRMNGTIQKVMFTAPDGTNAVTYQVQILDNEDKTIFDSGEQAENAEYAFSLSEPVTGTIDVVIGPSAAIGATNPDVVVTLRGK